MKRYKRILPSTVALITLTSSVATSNVFAETRNDYAGTETNLINETTTETTTGTAIKITSKEVIKPRIANGEKFVVDGWTYSYIEFTNTFTITDTIYKSGNVIIPESVNIGGVDYRVQALGGGLFRDSDELETVVIPEGVTVLGDASFKGCTALREVEMPTTVRSIGGDCFQGCSSITEINIPEGDAIIGSTAFADCTSLTKIKIPEGIRELKEGTFKGCESLTEVELPGSLECLYRYNFYGCTSLTEIKLPSKLKLISDNVFENTALMYIDIPENIWTLYLNFIGGDVYTLESENPNDLAEDKTTSAYLDVPLTGDVVDLITLPSNAEGYTGRTLYMKYNITPLIDLDGGEMGDDKIFPAWVTAENVGDYLDVPTKSGKVFSGWQVVKGETLNKNGVEYLVGLVELKATWEDSNEKNSKNVTFNANGGTPDTTVIEQTEGEKFILPETEPTKEGYKFMGWFDADGNQITKDRVVGNLVDGIVYTARWEEMTIEEILKNVIFDTNDDTLTRIEISQTIGNNFKLPDIVPNREGYEFLGWFDAAGVQITAEMIVDELEDGAVFYAKWAEKVIEKPTDETNTDNDSDVDYGTNDNSNVDSNVVNESNNTDKGTTTDNSKIEEQVEEKTEKQAEDPGELLFNQFSVQAGSYDFITKYADGSEKRTYAYNKTYIDPTTKSMYVSLRGVIDNSIENVTIKWDPKTRTTLVHFVDKGTKIAFTENSSIMTVNGVERQMLSAEGEVIEAQLVNGRIMIPLRFVSELFDFNVKYDNNKKLSVVYTSR